MLSISTTTISTICIYCRGEWSSSHLLGRNGCGMKKCDKCEMPVYLHENDMCPWQHKCSHCQRHREEDYHNLCCDMRFCNFCCDEYKNGTRHVPGQDCEMKKCINCTMPVYLHENGVCPLEKKCDHCHRHYEEDFHILSCGRIN